MEDLLCKDYFKELIHLNSVQLLWGMSGEVLRSVSKMSLFDFKQIFDGVYCYDIRHLTGVDGGRNLFNKDIQDFCKWDDTRRISCGGGFYLYDSGDIINFPDGVSYKYLGRVSDVDISDGVCGEGCLCGGHMYVPVTNGEDSFEEVKSYLASNISMFPYLFYKSKLGVCKKDVKMGENVLSQGISKLSYMHEGRNVVMKYIKHGRW